MLQRTSYSGQLSTFCVQFGEGPHMGTTQCIVYQQGGVWCSFTTPETNNKKRFLRGYKSVVSSSIFNSCFP